MSWLFSHSIVELAFLLGGFLRSEPVEAPEEEVGVAGKNASLDLSLFLGVIGGNADSWERLLSLASHPSSPLLLGDIAVAAARRPLNHLELALVNL
jgi:hypothetical protein